MIKMLAGAFLLAISAMAQSAHIKNELSFLTISDIHYGSKNLLKDGEDTGPEFLKTTFKKFKKLSKNVDFILYLGDLPTHFLLDTTQKGQFEKTVFHELYTNNTASKPLFYIPGNNDSLTGNYQPFQEKGISPLNFATDWKGSCAHCNGLMINDSQLHHNGYYSSYVIPQNKEIILIVLNATQWTKPPLLIRYPHQKHDALQQLFWLENQLKTHKAQQLLIALHEPPGNSYRGKNFWHQAYVNQFIKIMDKYKKLYGEITLLTSHTHMDELRKIRLTDGSAIYIYSTPSISRIHHNYPGMKVFHLNKNLKIKNFTTYYTSHLKRWKNQHYQAIGSADAIFPHCKNTLSQCLNTLSTKQICDHWDKGLFYGVKNPMVLNQHCHKIYNVLPD